jgi:hypothetical protein
LASAHFLFTTVLAEDGMIEFMTKSGILTAKKVPGLGSTGVPGEEQGKLFIELDFPMIDFLDCEEMPSIPETLNGVSMVSVHKSAADGDLIVMSLLFCLQSYIRKFPVSNEACYAHSTAVILVPFYQLLLNYVTSPLENSVAQ